MFVFGWDSSNSKWCTEGLYFSVSAKDLHMRKGSAAKLALAHPRRAARAHPSVPATGNFQVCWSIAPMPKQTIGYFLEDTGTNLHQPQQFAEQSQDGLAHETKRSHDFPFTTFHQGPEGNMFTKELLWRQRRIGPGYWLQRCGSTARENSLQHRRQTTVRKRWWSRKGTVSRSATFWHAVAVQRGRPTTSKKNEKTASGSSRLANRWARRINNLSHLFYKQKGPQLISILFSFANLTTSRSPTHWLERSLLDPFACV